MSELDELRTRVDRLESREAIRELVSAYAVACDHHDMPALDDLLPQIACPTLVLTGELDRRVLGRGLHDPVLLQALHGCRAGEADVGPVEARQPGQEPPAAGE